MSIRLMAQVWNAALPSSTHKLVLLAFADHANDEGECWPSIKKVAVKSQISQRQVQRIVADLKRNGLLIALKPAHGRKTPTYRIRGDTMTPLRCGNDAHVAAGVTNETARGDAHVAAGVTPMSPKPSREPSREPSSEPAHPNPAPAAAAAKRASRDGMDSSPRLEMLMSAYRKTFGLNGTSSEILREWSERLPEGEDGQAAVNYAFAEAAESGARSWRYVESILARLEANGWPLEDAAPGDPEADWLERRYQRGKAGESLSA